MALTKFKLGDLIELVDERNFEGIRNFYGVNINKEFMPTVADTSNLNEKNYKVVRKNRFVFSGMQTGRDECIRICLYQKDEPIRGCIHKGKKLNCGYEKRYLKQKSISD